MIYVNDIAELLLSLTNLFADDSSLFCSASSIIDLQCIINHDLQILSAWTKQWLISFNALKTEAILFTLKHFINLPHIILDGIPIKFVSDHKHLGLTLSNKDQWHKDIENIVSSASKVINIMRKLKFTFHRVTLDQMSFLRVTNFGIRCCSWDKCTIQDSKTLEKLQNKAARIVTGLTRSVSLVNLYRECGWVPLNTRRKEQKLAFMYKAVNDLTPDLIPHFVRDTTNYALRNNNNLAVPFTRTEISPKSCIPSSISRSLYGTRLTKRFVLQ